MQVTSLAYKVLLLLGLGPAFVLGEEPSRVLELLERNKISLDRSANEFGIQARLVASVIYAERVMNVNWMEDQLDLLLAQSGYSSSLGLGQVKIHTAEWIEKKLADSSSKYYLGSALAEALPKTKDREEMTLRLRDPQWNTRYVAAYLRMFCQRWLQGGHDISRRVDIVGTLYALGPYRTSDSSERVPHGNPIPNQFGRVAEEFFNSEVLRDLFPR